MKFAHRRSRSVVFGVLVAGLLAQGTISPLNAPAAQAATVPIDPTNVYVNNFEGWGTSLIWFANATGNWSNREALADALFSPSAGLGLNIARFNIGGSPATQPGLRPGALVRSYMNADGSYDWTVDANQRWWLGAAKARGVNITEAFANSAPWFMLENGDTRGAADCGNNLKADQYDDFANYLTTVVQHYRDSWGTTFRTLNPLNEATSAWCPSKTQEGMHVDIPLQDQLVGLTQASLTSKGLSTGVSAPDEWSPAQTQATLTGYSAANRNSIVQINAHSYGGDATQKGNLSVYASTLGKKLWMSEVDGSVGAYAPNAMPSANWLGARITEDLNSMRPAAWLLWQPIEDANNMANVENANWGLIHADLAGTSQTYSFTKKYYAMMNYTKFIRPGMQILASSGSSVVAYNPSNGQVVVVNNNSGSSSTSNTFDLSRFTSTSSTASVYRTSATENFASIGTVPITNKLLTHTAAAGSITTYVINNTVATPVTYYHLQARHSGQSVDVSSASMADGATVIQWPTSATAPNQEWYFRPAPTAGYYNVVSRNSGKCLDVSGASTANSAAVVQWRCGTGANQDWQIVTTGAYIQLKARHSGKCLDVPAFSGTAGTALVQYTCSTGTNQQFSRF